MPDSPGTWRHPRSDEIARRQRASTLSSRNIYSAAFNGLALILVIYVCSRPAIVQILIQPTISVLAKPLFFAIVLFFLYNITAAMLPLIRKVDEMTDIALTPSQRSLLGLRPDAPSSTPNTPTSTFITPPRYPCSPAPSRHSQSASSSRSMSIFGVNTADKGTPSSRPTSPLARESSAASISGQPGSAPSSPLWQKSRDGLRRASIGSPSPLSLGSRTHSGKGSSYSSAASPIQTATIPSKTGTGLNSKWLYERNKRSSGVY